MKFLTPFFCLFSAFIMAQTPETRLLKVYIDQFSPPENQYDLQVEFPFVDYTIKPTEGDVHVLRITDYMSTNVSRNGLCFFGLGRFKGQNDTIWYIIPPLTPELQRRDLVNDVFRRGIYPYLEQCGYVGDLKDLVGERPGEMEGISADDSVDLSWNKMQFSYEFEGYFRNNFVKRTYFNPDLPAFVTFTQSYEVSNGQIFDFNKFYKKWRIYGKLASYVEEKSYENKDNGNFIGKNRFSFSTFSSTLSVNRLVKNHFSTGFGVFHYTTYNSVQPKDAKNGFYDFVTGFVYNYFPYSQFYRRRLLLGYKLNFEYREDLDAKFDISPWSQRLYVNYYNRRQWGYIDFKLDSKYLFAKRMKNDLEVYFSGTTGLHVGNNVFLTLKFQTSSVRKVINRSLPTFPIGVYSKSVNNNSETLFGINYLMGSGSIRRIRPNYAFSDIENVNEEIGSNKWAFRLNGTGKYSTSKQSITQSGDKQSDKFNEINFSPSFGIGRVGRKYRTFTSLNAIINYTKVKNDLSNDETSKVKTTNLQFFHNSVYTFWDRFSIGSKLFLNQQKINITGVLNGDGKKTLDYNFHVGFDLNLIPNRYFLRKSWTLSCYQALSFVTLNNQQSRLTNHFYTNAFFLKKWGFWSLAMEFQPEKLNKPFMKYDCKADFKFAKKIQNTIFLTLNPRLFGNFEKIINIQNDYITKAYTWGSSLTFGFEYYFGRGKTTIINPSLYNVF
jgi:hypothetical protein